MCVCAKAPSNIILRWRSIPSSGHTLKKKTYLLIRPCGASCGGLRLRVALRQTDIFTEKIRHNLARLTRLNSSKQVTFAQNYDHTITYKSLHFEKRIHLHRLLPLLHEHLRRLYSRRSGNLRRHTVVYLVEVYPPQDRSGWIRRQDRLGHEICRHYPWSER